MDLIIFKTLLQHQNPYAKVCIHRNRSKTYGSGNYYRFHQVMCHLGWHRDLTVYAAGIATIKHVFVSIKLSSN